MTKFSPWIHSVDILKFSRKGSSSVDFSSMRLPYSRSILSCLCKICSSLIYMLTAHLYFPPYLSIYSLVEGSKAPSRVNWDYGRILRSGITSYSSLIGVHVHSRHFILSMCIGDADIRVILLLSFAIHLRRGVHGESIFSGNRVLLPHHFLTYERTFIPTCSIPLSSPVTHTISVFIYFFPFCPILALPIVASRDKL